MKIPFKKNTSELNQAGEFLPLHNEFFNHAEWLIVIPAQDEAQTIGDVIRDILTCCDKIDVVVIDDFSADNTADVARQAGARVIPLACSLGAWGAIQTGLRYALKHGYQHVITMDADGQHEAASLPALQHAIRDNDVIIGAYPQRGSMARRTAWHVFRALSGLHLEDLTSGLRAYNRPAIRLLASQPATLLDYQDMGVLLLLHQNGLRLREVPIEMKARLIGHSRIFSSWWQVSQYMFSTLSLCLAKFILPVKRRHS
jgi:glycosyltransferase involved in cell wall biosynthesis